VLSPVLQLVALYFSEIPCQGIFNVIGYNLIELNLWGLFMLHSIEQKLPFKQLSPNRIQKLRRPSFAHRPRSVGKGIGPPSAPTRSTASSTRTN